MAKEKQDYMAQAAAHLKLHWGWDNMSVEEREKAAAELATEFALGDEVFSGLPSITHLRDHGFSCTKCLSTKSPSLTWLREGSMPKELGNNEGLAVTCEECNHSTFVRCADA